MKRTLGYWFYFVAGLLGGREDKDGPRPQVMYVLASWFALMVATFLLAFSKYVFDLWGAYASLWSPTTNFRSPTNPNVQLGFVAFLLGMYLAYIGYRYLIDNRIGIPSRRRSLKDFAVFIVLCLWPFVILVASFWLGGVLFQCVVHSATVAFFVDRGKRVFPQQPI